MRMACDFCDVQGTYEPLVCGKGKYCPTPAEQIECPEEHFCPLGTVQPHPCPVMSLCNAGSHTPLYYGSLFAALITDVALLAILYGYRTWYKRTLRKRDEHYKVLQRSSSQKHTEFDADTPVHELPPHIQLLCAGFRRARQSLPPMLLEFESLSLRIPGVAGQPYRTILAGVTGWLKPGKVTAVLGPSGAGKTTFLNCLQGKLESNWQRAGRLRVNGEEQELRRFAKVRGFVPQEDTMHRDLSVYDNIRYSARMRLPSDWTAAEIEDHVNACILAVQLGGVQDGRIGDEHTRGVSGGQRSVRAFTTRKAAWHNR
jgi:ABC-type glutathione transport system ATPase component